MHFLAQRTDRSFTQLQVAMLCIPATLSGCALGTAPPMSVRLHWDSGVSRTSMEGAREGRV